MKIPFLDRTETLSKETPSKKPADRDSLFHRSDPMFVEQFKSLSSRFEYRIDVMQCKVVAVTSAVAGEGKTVSAMNLAMNLSASGRKKVLLIDVDLRKCDLAGHLRVTPVPGLTEFLAGAADTKEILRTTGAPGLFVIPGGMRISAPWELLSGERFRTFLKEARERFDLVLLDTPPVIPVSDTHALRDLVDGFVLVYRLGHTPHPMFRQALDDIGEKKLLGVVLNAVERESKKYYQRYYEEYFTEPKKA
jgi:capsular exopolysaccharide synthesis family protein